MNDDLNLNIYKIICKEINNFNNELEVKIDLNNGRNTRLFGGDAPLDSLELVTLIVNIEEAVEIELDHTITLANESAMSRRVSPFTSVGLLTDYVVELILEKQ
jgi:acyl carrier protein